MEENKNETKCFVNFCVEHWIYFIINSLSETFKLNALIRFYIVHFVDVFFLSFLCKFLCYVAYLKTNFTASESFIDDDVFSSPMDFSFVTDCPYARKHVLGATSKVGIVFTVTLLFMVAKKEKMLNC